MQDLRSLIARMQRDDREFITPDTVVQFSDATPEQARAALADYFGADWLARQDAARAR
jgi:hypothetical protein